MHAKTITTTLTPLALKDAPALIETVFPAQKVSFEAQKERKAQASQTLTALGSFWKGRKPLILVRAVVLGALLPATEDPEQDLDVFERLMAFDEESLARRALANNAFNVETLQELIPISDPERYFSTNGWRRDIGLAEKLELYRPALATFGSYEEKAALCKRPEEVDAEWLYEPVWPAVNCRDRHSVDMCERQAGPTPAGRSTSSEAIIAQGHRRTNSKLSRGVSRSQVRNDRSRSETVVTLRSIAVSLRPLPAGGDLSPKPTLGGTADPQVAIRLVISNFSRGGRLCGGTGHRTAACRSKVAG